MTTLARLQAKKKICHHATYLCMAGCGHGHSLRMSFHLWLCFSLEGNSVASPALKVAQGYPKLWETIGKGRESLTALLTGVVIKRSLCLNYFSG